MTDQRQCQECQAKVDEASGRLIILEQDDPVAGGEETRFNWSFLCIQCIRDWRERGLKRQGLPPDKVLEQLDHEYPFTSEVH